MPRTARNAPGGLVYHVLNRAVARNARFEKDGDYEAFEHVFTEALDQHPMRVLAYCIMPNHWHLIVWPRKDGELSRFTGWLTLTHTQRWHAHRRSAGSGHVYQGRFKSFPIQEHEHFLCVARYVERNALRAPLVRRTEQWRWGSLFPWISGSAADRELLAPWPLARKPNWAEHVNAPQTEAEPAAIRRSVERGNPFGDEPWNGQTARRLELETTLRPRGHPKMAEKGS